MSSIVVIHLYKPRVLFFLTLIDIFSKKTKILSFLKLLRTHDEKNFPGIAYKNLFFRIFAIGTMLSVF